MSAAKQVPEALVSKITLMAYALSPHPLKAVLQECLDEWDYFHLKTKDEWQDDHWYPDDFDLWYRRDDTHQTTPLGDYDDIHEEILKGYEDYLEECRNLSMIKKAELRKVYKGKYWLRCRYGGIDPMRIYV
jgi:hypothetical protein